MTMQPYSVVADYRQITFGTTLCRIYVRQIVDAVGRGPFQSVATAFADHDEVIHDDGRLVECHGRTDEQARNAMIRYLEVRFGERRI